MELNQFIRLVVRRWYIVAVLLVAAYAGTWLYHAVTQRAKATGTVAVLQPYVAAPGEYIPPQITFDTMDESAELARRVQSRLHDGTSAETLQNGIDIGLRISNRPTLTPLYEVSYSDRDTARAERVAGIVLDEAIALYGELNRPAEKDVRAAFEGERQRAQAAADAAQAALAKFESENDAFNLTARQDQTRGYLTQLHLLALQRGSGGTGSLLTAATAELDRLTRLEPEYTRLKSEADLAQTDLYRVDARVSDLTAALPAGPAIQPFLDDATSNLRAAKARDAAAQDALAAFRQSNAVADVTGSRQAQLALVNQLQLAETSTSAGSGTIDAAIAEQETALERLNALAPQYSQLSLQVGRAESQLSALEQHIQEIVGAQALPSQSQTLVLERPTLQSDVFWILLTYALATVVAAFAGLTLIYLLGVLARRALTVEEIEARLGLPVFATVTEVGSRKGVL